jgi:hypothetical protein
MEGFLPAFKLGNRWRFKKDLLDKRMQELIAEQGELCAPKNL